MLTSHLKLMLAQFRKNRLQALINIGGMAVGLAGCMLIAVYVLFELSYDAHYANAERTYRRTSERSRERSRSPVGGNPGTTLGQHGGDGVQRAGR